MSDKQYNPHLPWNRESSNFNDVLEFRMKIGLPINNTGTPKTFKDVAEANFWIDFLREEVNELDESVWDDEGDAPCGQNLAQTFDALLDLVYVAMGAAAVLGLPWQDGWDRVHAANMLKEPGTKPGRSGHPDAIKPEGWTAPDLTDLVTPREE